MMRFMNAWNVWLSARRKVWPAACDSGLEVLAGIDLNETPQDAPDIGTPRCAAEKSARCASISVLLCAQTGGQRQVAVDFAAASALGSQESPSVVVPIVRPLSFGQVREFFLNRIEHAVEHIGHVLAELRHPGSPSRGYARWACCRA
ncbi:MAG: hypothetical protein R3E92_03160 [Burkholderiaceae bacterium]